MNKKQTSGKESASSISSQLAQLRNIYSDLKSIKERFDKKYAFGGVPDANNWVPPKKKASGSKSGPKTMNSERKQSITSRTAPVSVGNFVGGSYARLRGNPQVLTDMTGNTNFEGARIEFSDILPVQVTITESSITQGGITACLDNGSSVGFYHHISPSALSAKLGQLEPLYEFYAFRKLRLDFIPSDGTSTNGTIIFGFLRDITSFVGEDLTTQYLFETEGAAAGSVWSVCGANLEFKGTKVYHTVKTSSSIVNTTLDECIQALMLVGISGADTVESGSKTFGMIRVSGVLDLYRGTSVSKTGNISDPKHLKANINAELMRRYLYGPIEESRSLTFREWYKQYGVRHRNKMVAQIRRNLELDDEKHE